MRPHIEQTLEDLETALIRRSRIGSGLHRSLIWYPMPSLDEIQAAIEVIKRVEANFFQEESA